MKIHVILGGKKGNQIVNDTLFSIYSTIRRNCDGIIEVSEQEVMSQILNLAKETLRNCEIAVHSWPNGDMLIFSKSYYATPAISNAVEHKIAALLN